MTRREAIFSLAAAMAGVALAPLCLPGIGESVWTRVVTDKPIRFVRMESGWLAALYPGDAGYADATHELEVSRGKGGLQYRITSRETAQPEDLRDVPMFTHFL